MLRAASTTQASGVLPFDLVVLTHAERHLRRKVLTLQHGDDVLVDLPKPQALAHGDRLVLDDGRHIEIIAAEEKLYEIRTHSSEALLEIAWHIGNRHLPAQIERERILIARDHVIKDMLLGLGATVTEILEPFEPARGAYHRHADGSASHAHSHAHSHDDDPKRHVL